MRRSAPIRRRPKRSMVAFRRAVSSRAGGMCEAGTPACPDGRHQGHHAHHVRLRSQGGADDVSNGLYVCSAAHRWIHDHPEQSYRRGWLRRTGAE